MDTPTDLPGCDVYRAAEPLWRLAPVRDAEGESLADFMLLVPRMRVRGPAYAEQARAAVRRVCAAFGEQVRFADLNLQTGVIWVTVHATPGLCARVAGAIRVELPEALMVGGQLAVVQTGLADGLWRRLSRIPRRVARRLLPSPPDSGPR